VITTKARLQSQPRTRIWLNSHYDYPGRGDLFAPIRQVQRAGFHITCALPLGPRPGVGSLNRCHTSETSSGLPVMGLFAAVHESGPGPTRKCGSASKESGYRGRAEDICSV
jgi:hypothetical protein